MNRKADWTAKQAIFSITPFTLLDYPDKTACIIWFSGCNMRCAYCYNPEIVLGKGNISFLDALAFLKSRVGLLDAVVFSGGECLLHQHIIDFAQKVKELGYKIKIDTNGSKPKVLETLLNSNLVDYVALDFKAPQNKYYKITKLDAYLKTIESLQLLVKTSAVSFEVRTTYHSSLLTMDDVYLMIKDLVDNHYQFPFYIQNFRNYKTTLSPLSESIPFINNKLDIPETILEIR